MHDLSAVPGSTKVSKELVEVMPGQGKTAGSHKGQSRSGASIQVLSGQMPFKDVYLKRFQQHFAKEIIAINVGSLESFENGAVVDTQALIDAGLVNKCCDGIKILGNGKLTKSLTVKVGAYSEGAKQKIESAGGKAEVI
ncbi:MAG: uL15 family ribosomal protein [Acutalibacteraceae bacterium]